MTLVETNRSNENFGKAIDEGVATMDAEDVTACSTLVDFARETVVAQ